MAKTIGTILSLTDKVSPKLITIGRNFDSLDKKQQAMAKSAAYRLNSYAKSLGSATTAAAKFAGASALALGGMGIKTGLSEAMGLETYRTQLITATKDTQRAAEVMRYAIDLANKTPFEGADMTSAAAVLEMAGMKTEKYLTLLGDVAAATNRQISDIQGGFTRAFQLGDYSALREATGMLLNAETVAAFARTRGITDQTEALYVMLTEKFGGGMAALERTTKGTWSTITGATKNALANIIGATNDGTVRAGSALDALKQKATGFADTLVRMQNDGTLDAWSAKIDTGFGKALESAEKLWKLLSNNKDVVLGIGGTILAVNSLGSGLASLNTILGTAKKLYTLFSSGALAISPAALAVGATALVGAVSYASQKEGAFIDPETGEMNKYAKNSQPARDSMVEFFDGIKNAVTATDPLEGLGHGISGLVGLGKAIFQAPFASYTNTFVAAGDIIVEGSKWWLENAKKNWTYGFDTLRNLAADIWDKATSGLNISKKVDDFFNRIFGTDTQVATYSSPQRNPYIATRERLAANALGTRFFRGGRSLVGEFGPELVELPVGARIYPHNETRQILQQTTNETQQFTSHSRTTNHSTQTINRGRNTITIHFTINGAGDPDQVADMVCGKILEVLDNV